MSEIVRPHWCDGDTWDRLARQRANLVALRPMQKDLDYVVGRASALAVQVGLRNVGVVSFSPGHGGRQLVTASKAPDDYYALLIGGSVIWSEVNNGRCYVRNPSHGWWTPGDITRHLGYEGMSDSIPLAELLTLTSAYLTSVGIE
jgi:hypothetical protein